jgi:hypothetical protein
LAALAGRAAELADAGQAGPAQLAALAAGFSALGWTGTDLYRAVSRALLLPGSSSSPPSSSSSHRHRAAAAGLAAVTPCASLDLSGVAAASAGMLRAGWAPADLFSALARRAEVVLAVRGQQAADGGGGGEAPRRRPAAAPSSVRPEHLALAAWALAAAGHARARLARLVAARTFELCRRAEDASVGLGGGFARRRDVDRLAAAFGLATGGGGEFPALPSLLPLPPRELAAVRAALRRERARLDEREQWRERRAREAVARRVGGEGGGGGAAR